MSDMNLTLILLYFIVETELLRIMLKPHSHRLVPLQATSGEDLSLSVVRLLQLMVLFKALVYLNRPYIFQSWLLNLPQILGAGIVLSVLEASTTQRHIVTSSENVLKELQFLSKYVLFLTMWHSLTVPHRVVFKRKG